MDHATPQLRVLKYEENGEWIAHLLEMDLVGTGATPEAAEEELIQAFEAQLTYCIQNRLNPFHPAPPELFEAWERAQKEEFVSFVQEAQPVASPRRAGFVHAAELSAYRTDGWSAQLCPG